jgi:hypothetical protein
MSTCESLNVGSLKPCINLLPRVKVEQFFGRFCPFLLSQEDETGFHVYAWTLIVIAQTSGFREFENWYVAQDSHLQHHAVILFTRYRETRILSQWKSNTFNVIKGDYAR